MNFFTLIIKSCRTQFNDFIKTTPIAGYKFTNCYANRLQQLFWHAILNFFLMVSFAIGLRFWYQYEYQSLLPVYKVLDFGTKLPYPAVYLCLGYPLNPYSLEKYRKKFLKSNLTMSTEEIDLTLQKMLRFQRVTKNDTYDFDELFRNNVDMQQLRNNLGNLYYKVDELLKDCYFKGHSVKCSFLFQAIEVAPGSCFVFNSIYTHPNFYDNTREQKLIREFSEFDMNWSMRFKIQYEKNTALMMYLKDPHNILSLMDYPNYVWRPRKHIVEYGFTIEDRYHEPDIRNLKLKRRKCLFSDENFPYKNLSKVFNTNFYNQDVCYTYCHALKYLELCKCLPQFARIFHNLAQNTKMCTLNELKCYEREYLNIRRSECPKCYADCNKTIYISKPEIQRPKNIKYITKIPEISSSLKRNYFEFTLDLVHWPLIQCRVINIFSTDEFLVAIASTSSLFLGTSFISFLEAFYGLFIRYFCALTHNREYIIKEIKKREEFEAKQPIPCINMSLKPGLKNN